MDSSWTETSNFLIGKTYFALNRPYQRVVYRLRVGIIVNINVCRLRILILAKTDTWEEMAVAASHSAQISFVS